MLVGVLAQIMIPSLDLINNDSYLPNGPDPTFPLDLINALKKIQIENRLGKYMYLPAIELVMS